MDVVVADIGETEAIIGLDFLETYHSVINIKHQTVDLQGLHLLIPLVKKSTGISTRSPTKDANISVVLSEDLYIPGSSQVEINAKLIDAVTVGTMLMEGRDITQRHDSHRSNEAWY